MLNIGNKVEATSILSTIVESIQSYYRTLILIDRRNIDSHIKNKLFMILMDQISYLRYLDGDDPNADIGFRSTDDMKKLLMDPWVTSTLGNLRNAVSTEVIYQIMYDREYCYVPPERRPKEGFMNLPE